MPRPPKLKNPRAIVAHVEAEIKEEWDKLRGRMSWGEFFTTWYLRQKEVINAAVKIENLERENEGLRKENEELKRLVERLQRENEKLRLENEALKQGRSVRSYQDALKLKELAKHAREGVSWKALCAEALGLRDEKKIKELLKLAFVVKKNDRNRFPDKFYPKDIAEEFHGWVLKRPETKVADIIDYELYREDTLKAAKAINKGEAVPEVKPLKTGKAAERWLATFFEVVERQYMNLLNQMGGKEAKRYLEGKVPEKLEKVLQDIDPEDWRRAVLAVLDELEARAEGNDRREVFVSNLRRVALRVLKEAHSHAPVLEVKADV
ncbi:hypothetical protein [Thermococcus sp. 9N3]|uniref:hypothetical protein n=1 Tax=Thermococcus sp. 9N3 TaxID=163002 RepID=UPI001431B9BF|nr:hypothetical protein [Thermococcus sp. 9N3]NJE48397.1 hypothetical protein [Thermococcus sp. 9N3]